MQLNVNKALNLFWFKKKTTIFTIFETNPLMFLNVKNTKQEENFDRILWNIDNMSPIKYFITRSGNVTLFFPRNRRLTEWSTELKKKLEWLNRGNRIGRRNVYFPITHALLFDKFVQHPRRIFCFKIHETEIAKTIWLPINSLILIFQFLINRNPRRG